MPIVPNYRAIFWSAGFLCLLLMPGSLSAQQTTASHDDGFATAIATDSVAAEPVDSIGFIPNWKRLLERIAEGDNDPRRRFIVSYEQMFFVTSPSGAAGTSASKAAHAAQQAMSAASTPTAAAKDGDSLSPTALENLGAGALGSLFPNHGTGSRFEFSRMETDTNGWSVSIMDLNNSSSSGQSPDGNHAARQR